LKKPDGTKIVFYEGGFGLEVSRLLHVEKTGDFRWEEETGENRIWAKRVHMRG